MNLLAMIWPAVVPAVIIFIAGLIVAVLKMSSTSDGKYEARSLMTDNELEFHFRLMKALPEHLIFPQVSMQALIQAFSADRRVAHADRLRIAQQRVDYVVCDPAGQVIAVIELDDRTHDRKKDAVRDKRLAQAGIRTIRYESKQRPALGKIRADVQALLVNDPTDAISTAPISFAASRS